MAQPKTAATEKAVGILHSKITGIHTMVSTKILELLESGEEDKIMEGLAYCSPALLTSMGNWVKQNDVTCQPEDVENLAKNRELLKQKRRRGRDLANISYIDDTLSPTGTQEE